MCFPCDQTEVASGSMKRSASTAADERVNGLWEEEKSPERVYRPRHKSYKAAGESCSPVASCVYPATGKHGDTTVQIQERSSAEQNVLLVYPPCLTPRSSIHVVSPPVSRSEHWKQGDRDRGRSKERCHLLSPSASRGNSEERSLQPSRSSSAEGARPRDKQVGPSDRPQTATQSL